MLLGLLLLGGRPGARKMLCGVRWKDTDTAAQLGGKLTNFVERKKVKASLTAAISCPGHQTDPAALIHGSRQLERPALQSIKLKQIHKSCC